MRSFSKDEEEPKAMNSFGGTTRRQPHLEIPKAATEPQVVISCGEEFLERAHQVAHKIEDNVRRVLDVSTNVASDSSPVRPNDVLSD